MRKVIVLFGPTASGKSSVAIELAKKINGEIISADSMQIYRGMEIGTAKVTPTEMQGIPHHLINIVDRSQNFNVADYKNLATNAIRDIFARGKIPIVCGGTGLYIDALIKNINFEVHTEHSILREELIELHQKNGNAWLHDKLKEVDPVSANLIHENNVKRVIRALEVSIKTGILFSEQKKIAIEKNSEFDFKLFGLRYPRNILYEKINIRVDQMFENGLLKEARDLYKHDLIETTTALQAIGYKECNDFFSGNKNLEEVIEKIKMETRRYAKRQITWFNRYLETIWIDCDELSKKEISIKISQFLSFD